MSGLVGRDLTTLNAKKKLKSILSQFLAHIKRLIAVIGLFIIYEFAWLISRVRPLRKRGTLTLTHRVLLIGTFDNANWFHAHIEPIVQSRHSEVILVCDRPIANVKGVTFCCPPRWANVIMPRAVAKFVWSFIAMRRHRPDMCMGYHVFPAGVIALIVGRLFGRPSAFQMTSGPLELEGGGWHAENRLLIALGRPSQIIERSALRMLREFDLVVVRGTQAKSYIEQTGYKNGLLMITGSVVLPDTRPSFDDRRVDIIFVGRLTEYKRPDRFLDVVTALSKSHPEFRAVVLGDGPDAPELQAEAEKRGLTDNIQWNGKTDNVDEFLAISRIFLLTSRWEGVSIAMLEAMGAGCVPVVSDVGDLRDFVSTDVTGYVLPENAVEQIARRIGDLLDDAQLWERLSTKSRSEIEARASMHAITICWRQALTSTVGEGAALGGTDPCVE